MTRLLWTQMQNIGPPGRAGTAMAFDPVRSKTVLFGGTSTDIGTWEWDGRFWTQVADIGPTLRREHALAWHEVSKRIVLFGGAALSNEPDGDPADATVLGDTWEWDGEQWTQVDDSGPAPRFAFALAGDTTRGRVVLVGGAAFTQGAPHGFGDTWEWDGERWTQQDESGPSARSGHKMTFDSGRGRAVMFGGATVDGNGLRDTWEWSGSSWVHVSDIGPSARVGAALCFDGSQCVLFGG